MKLNLPLRFVEPDTIVDASGEAIGFFISAHALEVVAAVNELATVRREGEEAMRAAAIEACRSALQSTEDIVPLGRAIEAIRALRIRGVCR